MPRAPLLPGALLLLACDTAPVPVTDTGAVSRPPSAASTSDVTASPADSVALTLDAPRDVRPGDPVPLVVRARNVAAREIGLYLRGREITVDVTASDANGRIVWQRLRDANIPAIIQLRTLASGEELELRLDWDQRGDGGAAVPPGHYTLNAQLLTDSAPLTSAPVPLQIGSRSDSAP